MSDQSTETSEETEANVTSEIDWHWHVRMYFILVLLVMILLTLVDIHATLKDQKDQDAQAYIDQNGQYDLVYEQVEILYETQRIICDALDGPNEQVGGTTPINTEEPSIPTTTTTQVPQPPSIPGEAPPHAPAVDPIEAYC